jgi:hypothetical protein
MSKEKNNNFANVRMNIKLIETKNLAPVKQKSVEFDTPTKPKADRMDKSDKSNAAEGQKVTPKKESKEERKEPKVKKLSKKGDSGPQIDAEEAVDESERESIIELLIKHVLIEQQQ